MKHPDDNALGIVLGDAGISRRDFLGFCATLAAAYALPASSISAIAAALEKAPRASVIWLSFQECTGCTESLTRSHTPSIEGLILEQISLDYHHTLQAASGAAAERARIEAMRANAGKYLLVVDGSVPLGNAGYSTIAGISNLDMLMETAKGAAAVIAVGTCAAYGGLPAASPNPTGAVAVSDLIQDKPVINVPGCPPIPVVITGVLAHFLTFGTLPELDERGRPKIFYGESIHDRCYRRPFYDQGKFAASFDDEVEQRRLVPDPVGPWLPRLFGTGLLGHGIVLQGPVDAGDAGAENGGRCGGSGCRRRRRGGLRQSRQEIFREGGARARRGRRPGTGEEAMSGLELLVWARGPGLALALGLCSFGVILRFVEILSLGRKTDLSPARADTPGSGWRTLLSRSLPPPGMVERAPLTYFGGYVFHSGMAITVFFFAPHIELIRGLFGLRGSGLPNSLIDVATIAAILAMIALLIGRFADPVKRLISGGGDWLAWALTFAPLITGYAAYHHWFANYTLTLAVHILSVELLLVLLPFSKLFHAFSLFLARWYNGEISGRKGVAS